MIKGKGKLRKIGGILQDRELRTALDRLPDNQDYDFLIYDHKSNRLLPNLAYLHSVVLKQISDALPDHPSVTALYKYFEEMFAPWHTCTINGEDYEYPDLKNEKATDFGNVVERIVEYAQKRWNITVTGNTELKDAEARDFFARAYAQQEIDWSIFISSLNKKSISEDERRNKNRKARYT